VEARLKALWAFLNSPFTLLLISSGVIGILGAAYTNHEEKLRELRNNQTELSKLELELSLRSLALRDAFHEMARLDLIKGAAPSAQQAEIRACIKSEFPDLSRVDLPSNSTALFQLMKHGISLQSWQE
jgi:hypothetical protein